MMSIFNIEGSGGAIEYACAQVKVAPSLIIPLSENGTDKGQRIKELESTILDLQSELARKKYSLTVACNRVEELEDRLKLAIDTLKNVKRYLPMWGIDTVRDTLKDLGVE